MMKVLKESTPLDEILFQGKCELCDIRIEWSLRELIDDKIDFQYIQAKFWAKKPCPNCAAANIWLQRED